jgi:hypothetical protein
MVLFDVSLQSGFARERFVASLYLATEIALTLSGV